MICYLYAANIGKITLRVKPFYDLFSVIKEYLTHFGLFSSYLPKSMDIPAWKLTPSVRGAFR